MKPNIYAFKGSCDGLIRLEVGSSIRFEQFDTLQSSFIRLGTVLYGSSWFYTARSDSIRFGTAQGGSIRLETSQFNSVSSLRRFVTTWSS